MTADQLGDVRPVDPMVRTDSDGFIPDRARLLIRGSASAQAQGHRDGHPRKDRNGVPVACPVGR